MRIDGPKPAGRAGNIVSCFFLSGAAGLVYQADNTQVQVALRHLGRTVAKP